MYYNYLSLYFLFIYHDTFFINNLIKIINPKNSKINVISIPTYISQVGRILKRVGCI